MGYILYYFAAWFTAGLGAWFLALSPGYVLGPEDLSYIAEGSPVR